MQPWQVWPDFSQAHLHPRSLAPLAAFDHGHSEMRRWRDGAAVVRRQAERDENSSLLERVRRFLEECDTPQGFHCLFEADGGFGGLTHALLTEVRDDYCSAPCLSLALNMHRTPHRATEEPGDAGEVYNLGEERADAARALSDTMALTSLSDLRCCVVPLYDAGGGAAARLYAPRPSLPYHTSAPLAALLECISLPMRTRRPRSSLTSLCHAVGVSAATPLAAAALAMPPPPDGAPPPATSGPEWFVGLTPLQLAPRNVTAMGQFVSVLGQPSGTAACSQHPGSQHPGSQPRLACRPWGQNTATLKPARLLSEGKPPRGAPSYDTSRQTAAALWCLPKAANFSAF